MQLNLNNLLEEIYSWKTLLRRKDGEIENMKNKIMNSYKKNKILEETHKTLLLEIAEFNNVLSSLHASITRLEDCEVEKRFLASEKKKLENYIEDQKKLHQKEVEDLSKEVEQMKSVYKRGAEAELLQFESKASAKQESYLNIIKEKDKRIFKLEDEISRLNTGKDQDVLKLKIEYEEIINRLKNKLLKAKVSHPRHDDFHKDDIFRQKYMKLEKESREETEKLKARVTQLQSQIDNLKSQDGASIHALILKATPLNNPMPNIETSRSYDEEYSYRSKRFRGEKIDDNYDPTNTKNNSIPNHTELVRPVKKKLFNLDLNYF